MVKRNKSTDVSKRVSDKSIHRHNALFSHQPLKLQPYALYKSVLLLLLLLSTVYYNKNTDKQRHGKTILLLLLVLLLLKIITVHEKALPAYHYNYKK